MRKFGRISIPDSVWTHKLTGLRLFVLVVLNSEFLSLFLSSTFLDLNGQFVYKSICFRNSKFRTFARGNLNELKIHRFKTNGIECKNQHEFFWWRLIERLIHILPLIYWRIKTLVETPCVIKIKCPFTCSRSILNFVFKALPNHS